MKKPLALTLIAALALSACATNPPPSAVPMGYLVGSLGYEPEGKELGWAQLKICNPNGEVVWNLNYRFLDSDELTEPGFAGKVFIASLPAGTYDFCGSVFSERPADPSTLAQVRDVARGAVVIIVFVAMLPALALVAGLQSSAGTDKPTPRTDLQSATLTVEAGKIGYIGRYRGFQQPWAGGPDKISSWVVLDNQAGDLSSVLKQQPNLTDLPVIKTLPSADLWARDKPAPDE